MTAVGQLESAKSLGIGISPGRACLGVLLATLLGGWANAQSPDLTDPLVPDRPGFYCGSWTVPKGVFQVETGFAYARSDEGAVSETSIATPAVFRIGLLDDLELRINFAGYNRLRLSSEDGRQVDNGAGSAALGMKWQFAEMGDEGLRPSMALLFSVDLAVGSRFARPERAAPSLVWASDFALPAGFGLAANVGLSAPFDGEAEERFAQLFLAAGLSRAIAQRAALFLEVAANHPDSSGGDPQTVLDGGVTYLVNNDLQLDFSLIKGLTEEAGDWALAAGVSFRFH